MYPEWIIKVIGAFNGALEEDSKEGQLLMIRTHAERRPKEFIKDEYRFELTKKLLLEENILMEIEYRPEGININYTKRI